MADSFECPVCLGSVPQSQSVVTECGHRFCASCLEEWVKGLALPGCPASSCPSQLTPKDVMAALCADPVAGAERARRLEEDLSGRAVLMLPGLISCKAEDCPNAVTCSPCSSPRTGEKWECGCGGPPLCSLCGELWHPGANACSDLPELRGRWLEWRSQGLDLARKHGPPRPPPTFQDILRRHGLASEGAAGGTEPATLDALASALRRAAADESATEGFASARASNAEQRRQLVADERYKAENCRHCPYCGRLVERRRGCDNMVCGDDFYGKNKQRGCRMQFKWSECRRYVPQIALGNPDADGDASLSAWLSEAEWRAQQTKTCGLCGRAGWVGPRLECLHCEALDVCVHCDLSGRLSSEHDKEHCFRVVWGDTELSVLRAEARAVETQAADRATELLAEQQRAREQWERDCCRRAWPVAFACCLLLLHMLVLFIPSALHIPEQVECSGWIARSCACGDAIVATAADGPVLDEWPTSDLLADCVPSAFYVSRHDTGSPHLGIAECTGFTHRYKLFGKHDQRGWLPVRADARNCGADFCIKMTSDRVPGATVGCWRRPIPDDGCFVMGREYLGADPVVDAGSFVTTVRWAGECTAGVEPGLVECGSPIRGHDWQEVAASAPAVQAAAAGFRAPNGGSCSLIRCHDLVSVVDFLSGPDKASEVDALRTAAAILALLSLACLIAMQAPVFIVAFCHSNGRCTRLRWSGEPLGGSHALPVEEAVKPEGDAGLEAGSLSQREPVYSDASSAASEVARPSFSPVIDCSLPRKADVRSSPASPGSLPSAAAAATSPTLGPGSLRPRSGSQSTAAETEALSPTHADGVSTAPDLTGDEEEALRGHRQSARVHRRNLTCFWAMVALNFLCGAMAFVLLEVARGTHMCQDDSQRLGDLVQSFGAPIWLFCVYAMVLMLAPCVATCVMTNVCLQVPEDA
eukprot:TRINITY_DN1780_c0_g3_i2.p1 TRINITY_DN1780_c0_g3~~TRINITY_DN1780_c0_g3_i2.p1  ORF type:complete len:928 (+),score=232.25 TRINITY_DN1780_c0_g3_i2:62-2845(+)